MKQNRRSKHKDINDMLDNKILTTSPEKRDIGIHGKSSFGQWYVSCAHALLSLLVLKMAD